jgi:hypothetical protein
MHACLCLTYLGNVFVFFAITALSARMFLVFIKFANAFLDVFLIV